jgi:hypothetical protein
MQRRNSLGVGGATGIRHPHPCLPERACGDRARLHFAGFPRPPLEPGGRDRIKPPRENRGKAQPRGKESKVRSLCQKQTRGAQDQGGKHGGQSGMPKPEPRPTHGPDQGIVRDEKGQEQPRDKERAQQAAKTNTVRQ